MKIRATSIVHYSRGFWRSPSLGSDVSNPAPRTEVVSLDAVKETDLAMSIFARSTRRKSNGAKSN